MRALENVENFRNFAKLGESCRNFCDFSSKSLLSRYPQLTPGGYLSTWEYPGSLNKLVPSVRQARNDRWTCPTKFMRTLENIQNFRNFARLGGSCRNFCDFHENRWSPGAPSLPQVGTWVLGSTPRVLVSWFQVIAKPETTAGLAQRGTKMLQKMFEI